MNREAERGRNAQSETLSDVIRARALPAGDVFRIARMCRARLSRGSFERVICESKSSGTTRILFDPIIYAGDLSGKGSSLLHVRGLCVSARSVSYRPGMSLLRVDVVFPLRYLSDPEGFTESPSEILCNGPLANYRSRV